jgi:hypothetical protein
MTADAGAQAAAPKGGGMTIPPNVIEARRMYAAGAAVGDILPACGLTLHALYFWLDGGDGLLPLVPRRRVKCRRAEGSEGRAALVRRLMRVTETRLRQIEKRMVAGGLTSGESDSDMRAHAVAAGARSRRGRRQGRRKSVPVEQGRCGP